MGLLFEKKTMEKGCPTHDPDLNGFIHQEDG
jgi:hypothetical protein